MKRRALAKVAWLLLVAGLVAGCDKCGDRLKLNTPTLPGACGAHADPAK